VPTKEPKPKPSPDTEPTTIIAKTHKKNNPVWIVVAVVAIVALIALGIYSYLKIKSLNKKVSDQQGQITELQNSKQTLEDAAKAAAASAANAAVSALNSSNYLEITELGFKLPLTDDIKDAVYFVNDKTVFISTSSLMSSAWGADSSDAAKYCAPGVLPLGAITKFANSDEAGPTQQKAVGNFVIGYAAPQSYCSDNAATTAMQNKQKAALIKAFQNAQPIK
jgi:hypothetical protein